MFSFSITLVERVEIRTLTIWWYGDAFLKILAMRHPRRLVLLGCLSATIVRKSLLSLWFNDVFLSFFKSQIIQLLYMKFRIFFSFESQSSDENLQILLGDDHFICSCRLGCSKSGKHIYIYICCCWWKLTVRITHHCALIDYQHILEEA